MFIFSILKNKLPEESKREIIRSCLDPLPSGGLAVVPADDHHDALEGIVAVGLCMWPQDCQSNLHDLF